VNILLLGWNRFRPRHPKGNIGHELFRRELAKYHNVLFYGQKYFLPFDTNITLPDLFERFGKPDLVFTHVEHRERLFPIGIFDELGRVDILKAHYLGDYSRLASSSGYDAHLKKTRYDVVFAPFIQTLEDLKKNGIPGNHLFLPFSVDTSVFYNRFLEKKFDVSTPVGRNERQRVKLKLFIGKLNFRTAVDCVKFENYIRRINESKIIVTSNSRFKQLSLKYFEVLACGTLLLTNRPEGLDQVGMRDGKHLVLYDGFKDLENKISYFLTHDKEREAIAKEGMELVRKYHSNRVRVVELTEMLKTRKQIDWRDRIQRGYTPVFSTRV